MAVTASRLPSPLERIYRKRDLELFFGLKRTTIAKLIRLGKFPRGMALSGSGNARGWTESELLEYQKRFIAERRKLAADLAFRRRLASMPNIDELEDDAA